LIKICRTNFNFQESAPNQESKYLKDYALIPSDSSRDEMTSNVSNMRKSVSSGYPNPAKWVEKTRRSRVFLTDFEVFGYLMKHSFESLIWLFKPFIILGEIQRKRSQNFMLIKIRYPNHHHGSDFHCFLFMNY